MTAPAVDAPIVPDDAIPAPAPAEPVDVAADAIPNGWRGPIMPVNTRSGDGRIYLLDESITEPPCRPLPLPLSAQKHLDDGHDGSVVVGLIRRVWLQDGAVWAEGTFDLDDEDGREWARKVANGQRWVSADLSDVQAEEVPLDADGGELDAASVDVLDLELDTLIRVTSWKLMGVTLCAGPAFEDAHIESADVEPTGLTASLIAAGIAYDAADFQDPQLSELTALQVTDDGRVFGHLAGWRSCHIGFQGACVTAPRSNSNYRYFHQGAVRTTDGQDLPVGKLTLGTGHAPTRPGIGATAAAAHYDNTGAAAAVVRCGEDQHGIWVSGRVLPGTSEQRIDELRRSGISGDWRTITPGGGLELVAALAVNVPGFPIPRTRSMAASGEAALVAAGVVTPASARAVEASMRRARATVLAQRMRTLRAQKVHTRMNRIRAQHLRARMNLVAAGPPDPDGTQMVAGQRIVRTQAGADRYGVAIGDPIPTGGGAKSPDAIKSEWDQIKAENPAGSKKGKGGGKGSGAKKADDTTTKGQPPSGVKKIGSSAPARKSGDTAYMEEDEAPDESPQGGKLVDYKGGVAYYSDGTLSDGKSWYEQDQEKASKKGQTKPTGGTAKRGTKPSTTTGGTTTAPTQGSTPKADPISSFVDALVRALAPKPQTGRGPAPGAGPAESGPTPEQRQRLQSLLDRLQAQLDERDQQRAITAAGQLRTRMASVRVAALRRRMTLARQRHVRDSGYWGLPEGTPITPGMKPKGKGGRPGASKGTSRETKAAAARRTQQDLDDAIANGDFDNLDALVAAATKAEEAHKAERDRARTRRDKERQVKQDAMDQLIDKGWTPDEAEAEAFGRPLERIRRRDAIAAARAGGATVRGFDDAVRALHTAAVEEQYDATEGGSVQGYRLKAKYAHLPEMVLWTSRSDAAARKYMTDEMAEWFDQNGGRITQQVVRDSWLAGRGGHFDTTQQGYYQ